jgi:hypothetical protein
MLDRTRDDNLRRAAAFALGRCQHPNRATVDALLSVPEPGPLYVHDVTLSLGATYNAGAAASARASLTEDHGWQITDGGPSN